MRHPSGIIRTIRWAVVMIFVAFIAARPGWCAPTVLIDPGHGGDDRGVRISDNLYEKDVTVAIARMIQRNLLESGRIAVQLTRNDDRELTTAQRTTVAVRLRPQLLVGLHVNAGFGRKSCGYEMFFPGFGTTRAPGAARSVRKDGTKTAYLNESVRFAQIAGRHLERVFPRKGRGLRDADIPLLEGTTLPAVVVEIGFATHPDDKKSIADPATQKAIAQALSVAISDYFR